MDKAKRRHTNVAEFSSDPDRDVKEGEKKPYVLRLSEILQGKSLEKIGDVLHSIAADFLQVPGMSDGITMHMQDNTCVFSYNDENFASLFVETENKQLVLQKKSESDVYRDVQSAFLEVLFDCETIENSDDIYLIIR